MDKAANTAVISPANAEPLIAADCRRHGKLPPVILLGGEANALSVARDLGRMGVAVHLLCEGETCIRHTRFARWIRTDSWEDFLLGSASDDLRGAILLACSDAGLQLLNTCRQRLASRFRLDESHPPAQEAMLDKLATYKIAAAAGVATPKFWEITSRQQVLDVRGELVFPLLVKPRLSHVFEKQFGRKFLTAENFEQLLAGVDAAEKVGVDVLLMELIPGPDDLLCSYFTYLDAQSRPMFDFTKRVIRRFPVGMGGACYHITDWIPQIVEPGKKLFAAARLRGLANIEFKLDRRDGQYKLIECNARFVASNALVSASGLSLARFVYRRLTDGPPETMNDYRRGLRQWDPIRDWWAFHELRAKGQMTLGQWVRSILHRQTFQYFQFTDPLPATARVLSPLLKKLRKNRL